METFSIKVHRPYAEVQSWGSEANNKHAKYGYWEHAKPRWQQIGFEYHDMAALAKFGIDPRRPPGGGIIMSANHYGFPQMGYTTGYTTKLPPPANFEVARRTPLSSNSPSIVEASDGTNAVPTIPSDDPVNYINTWKYGSEVREEVAGRHVVEGNPHQMGSEPGDHRVQAQPGIVKGPFVF